jgi:hypothetical protein
VSRPGRPSKFRAEVSSGDRVRALTALRDRLAEELEHEAKTGFCETCKRSSSSVAPLAKRLEDVLAVLDGMEPAKEGTGLDEFTRRRQARVASDG